MKLIQSRLSKKGSPLLPTSTIYLDNLPATQLSVVTSIFTLLNAWSKNRVTKLFITQGAVNCQHHIHRTCVQRVQVSDLDRRDCHTLSTTRGVYNLPILKSGGNPDPIACTHTLMSAQGVPPTHLALDLSYHLPTLPPHKKTVLWLCRPQTIPDHLAGLMPLVISAP